MNQLICCSEAEAETDRQITLPRLRALFAAVGLRCPVHSQKTGRKLLEFSDFEHLACVCCMPRMVKPPLCENIRQDYAAVMVDEGIRTRTPCRMPLPLPCRPAG